MPSQCEMRLNKKRAIAVTSLLFVLFVSGCLGILFYQDKGAEAFILIGLFLVYLLNQQIKGKVNDAGEEIKQVQCQCRGGFCGMCKIKVVDGEYVMHDHAIKELCMDDTETLACSTKVISDEIEIELNI